MTRSSIPSWACLVLLTACGGCETKDKGETGTTETDIRDDDGDGYLSDVDCDDDNDEVNPDAQEVCDGDDNDCDGMTDDADPSVDDSTKDTWYTDQDGDFYGTDDSASLACSQPYGNSVIDGGDCDDDDPDLNPGELEICDGVDNDCDGQTDLNAVDGYAVYEDADGDDYGAEDVSIVVCDATEGYTEQVGDCDDAAFNVNPGEIEACFNEIDDNCDGDIDDSCPQEVCGDVTEDITWENIPFGYYVSCDIAVLAELTIEPETIVYFAPNVGMTVGVEGPGALIIEAEGNPVSFTSGVSIVYPDVAPEPGDWTGLEIGENADEYTTRLEGLSLWYAGGEDSDGGVVMSGISLVFAEGEICGSGGDGFAALDGAMPELADSIVCDNVGHGFYADDDSGAEVLDQNLFSGNAAYPVSVLARYGDVIEGSNVFEDHAGDVSYIELRGDEVTEDITLAAQDYAYAITSDVKVYASGAPMLTLEDGVSVAFAYEAGLQIGNTTTPGDWTVEGSDEGVLLTAMDASRGWDGVTVQQGSDAVLIEGLTLEYGGNNGKGGLYLVNGSTGMSVSIDGSRFTHSSTSGLYVGPAVEPAISGSEFSSNATYGVEVSDAGTSEGGLYVDEGGASFVSNTLTENAASMTLPASYLDQLDDSSSFTGNDSPYIEVTGSTVERTGDWQQLDADLWVLGDVAIEHSSSPIITIAAGATFYMDPDTAMSVGDANPGGLVVEGTAGAPVTLTSAEESPSAGDWDGLVIGEDALETTSLSYLAVSYGGGNGSGAILIDGTSPELTGCEVSYSSSNGIYVTSSGAEPEIVGCTLQNNEESGVYVHTSGGLGGFEGNTMTGNGEFPASVNVKYAGALDSGSEYTGNGDDRVNLLGDKVSDDASWEGLEVPYYSDELITVSADLVLSAGVDIEFSGASAGFNVGSVSSGSLTTNGTSSNHVTMSSGEAPAGEGDWAGLTLSSYCTASTMKYLDISYADVGIYVNCAKTISISNSSFTDSASYDIRCGSRATAVTWSSVDYDTSSGCTP